MDTVTTQPVTRATYGSVEHYAEMLDGSPSRALLLVEAVGIIEAITTSGLGTDAEKIERIRNVVAAEKQILARMGAGR